LIESDFKREHQRAFRERVMNDRNVSFFNNSDELGRLVSQSIHNVQTETKGQMALSAGKKSGKTWLLFPFLTCQMGFDSGISVSNVSADPIRTVCQVGGAKIYFYGVNAPATLQTSDILPGQIFTTSLSTCAPNFQGYVIVECGFRPARGFGIVTDLGMRNVATGYLAEVIRESNEQES
jgi:hypothetical protein